MRNGVFLSNFHQNQKDFCLKKNGKRIIFSLKLKNQEIWQNDTSLYQLSILDSPGNFSRSSFSRANPLVRSDVHFRVRNSFSCPETASKGRRARHKKCGRNFKKSERGRHFQLYRHRNRFSSDWRADFLNFGL